MPSFTKEELIAAHDLRTVSQRDLFHTLQEYGKLGVLYKDQLTAVMLPHDRYITIINRLKELEETLHEREVTENVFPNIEKESQRHHSL